MLQTGTAMRPKEEQFDREQFVFSKHLHNVHGARRAPKFHPKTEIHCVILRFGGLLASQTANPPYAVLVI